MATLYFRNVRTNRRYRIVKIDKDANTVTLQGEYAEFEEPYDKARFQQLGYVLEKEETPSPE